MKNTAPKTKKLASLVQIFQKGPIVVPSMRPLSHHCPFFEYLSSLLLCYQVISLCVCVIEIVSM